MPLSTVDRGKILKYLDLGVNKKPQIDVLCDNLERISEQLVSQVSALLVALDANNEEITKAASGMVKLDVIEWKPERACGLYRHRSDLAKQLANAIGYQLESVEYW
jgi:hypothetical protein